MSAAVNDRPYQEFSPHLPLTGDLHPLRREFERWLLTGNAIAITVAMIVFAGVYLWPRPAQDGLKDLRRLVEPRGVYPSPPPVVPGRNNVGVEGIAPIVEKGIYEPVPDPVNEIDPEVTPGGSGENTPGTPSELPNDGGLPGIIDPPATPPVWNGGWTEAPVLLSIQPPVYPEILRDAGIDGEILVRVLIGVNGKVKDAYVVEGSSALRDAALASARTAIFQPAKQGVYAVEVWVVIPIRFALSGHD